MKSWFVVVRRPFGCPLEIILVIWYNAVSLKLLTSPVPFVLCQP